MIGTGFQFVSTAPGRVRCLIILLLLHLIVAPCAMAMTLTPADAACQHCQAVNGSDACNVAAATTGILIENLSFDAGPVVAAKIADLPGWMRSSAGGHLHTPRSLARVSGSRWQSGRRSSEPPLFLLLGRLRN
jgi:hypothetical protein